MQWMGKNRKTGPRAWGATSPGDKPENEDRLLLGGQILPQNPWTGTGTAAMRARPGESLVVAVADGISGCANGGLAAQLTLEALEKCSPESLFVDAAGCLEALNEAVAQGFAQVYGPGAAGGSTLAAVAVTGGLWQAITVGDSPVYRWEQGALTRLTKPHTVAAYRREQGLGPGSPEEEHALYEFMGNPNFLPGLVKPVLGTVQPGTALLLCSDGVAEALTEAEMADILNKEGENGAWALVAAAEAAGAGTCDNLSAVVLWLA